jgi:hypothetical protein
MSIIIPQYWFAIMAVAAFVGGVFASPAITPSFQQLGTEEIKINEIEKFSNEIGDEIKKLSKEIDEIKSRPDESQQPIVSDDINDLQRQIQIIDARIDRLNRLSNDIDELKKEVVSLKTLPPTQSQLLTALLDKFEYRAGDSLIVNGIGSPNRSVKISLLDSNRITISEGSTISDTSGRFTFTILLSSALSDGNYFIRVAQDSNSVEKTFRITSTLVQVEGFTLRTDNKEYLRGERVLFTGSADPNTWIDFDIFDSNNVQIVRTAAKSDANGRYSLEYAIPSNAPLGEYEVKASMVDKQLSIKFFVVLTKSTISSTSNNLAINTDRTIYNRGDFVTVIGKGIKNEKVTILVDPPAGDNLILTVNADSFGNYRTMFAIKQDAAKGTWEIIARQGTDSTKITITVI